MDLSTHDTTTLYWYYGIATLIALMLVLRGRKSRGMRLRLGGSSSRPGGLGVGEEPAPKLSTTAPDRRASPRGAERSLNVVFNWNGHSWDAYEVLGLPAGTSYEKVEVTFAKALREQGAEAHPFLRAAFEAIRVSSRGA